MSLRIDATITLLLREQDVTLLLKAMQQFKAETDEEQHGRDYLRDVLAQLAISEKPVHEIFAQ
jgi:hypothetical protein